MFCGEQFPKQIADAWRIAAPNSTIENLYGPTETTIYISRYCYDIKNFKEHYKNAVIPIGFPFPNQKVAIVDLKNNPVEAGEIGEICFKGSQVTDGYLLDKEKTDKVFVDFEWDNDISSKWYKTGDLGFINSNNAVECIGRADSQIKIAGRRIEIGEIESVLRKFEKISDIVIIALRDSSNIVFCCVGFTLSNISKSEELEIRKQSECILERVFFPKKIIKLEQFPLTISGKIDRKELEIIGKSIM
jgi:acyl-coenzyme A synthetase/AMP-(fatty) acid ligase